MSFVGSPISNVISWKSNVHYRVSYIYIVCRISNIECRKLNVLYWMSYIQCRMSCIVCVMSITEGHMLNVVSSSLIFSVKCRMHKAVCWMSYVVCWKSYVECRMSKVVCWMSFSKCQRLCSGLVMKSNVYPRVLVAVLTYWWK